MIQSFSDSISKLNSRASPELGVGAEVIVEAVGVFQIAVDAPLAVAGGDVEELVEVVAGGEAELKVLQARVLSSGASESPLAEDGGNGRFGGGGDAGAFNEKIVGDPGLEIPAAEEVIVVGGVNIRRKERLVAAEQDGIVDGDLGPAFAGVESAAVGEDVSVVAGGEDHRADAPFQAENRADFLEGGDRVLIQDVSEDSDEGVGKFSQIPGQLSIELKISALVERGVGVDEVSASDATIEVVGEVVHAHVDVDAAGVGAFIGGGGSGKCIDAGVLGFEGETGGFLRETCGGEQRRGQAAKGGEHRKVGHGGMYIGGRAECVAGEVVR